MTENQFKAAVETMINSAFHRLEISKQVSRVISSGSVDIDVIPQDDYLIVKAASHAIALHLSEQLRPLTQRGLKESKNIQKFI